MRHSSFPETLVYECGSRHESLIWVCTAGRRTNDHIATTLLIIASLSALETAHGHALSWGRYALFTLTLTLAINGDKLALWIAAIPVMIVCAGRTLKKIKGGDGLNNAVLLGSCLCAIVASQVILKLIQRAGGFTEVPFKSYVNHVYICLNKIIYLKGSSSCTAPTSSGEC